MTWKTIKGNPCQPTKYPGVWLLKDGRYWIRARAKHPRTGKLVEVNRKLAADSAAQAAALLQEDLDRIKQDDGARRRKDLPRFSVYAASVFEKKVAAGELGHHSQRLWSYYLRCHLLPAFGDYFVDKIRHADCLAYRQTLAASGCSPHAGNGYLGSLRVIVDNFVAEFELPVNPMTGVKPLDRSLHRVYTREQPNSLEQAELSRFLDLAAEHHGRLWAMFVVGFALGRRTCELLPLRYKGPCSDVLWDEGTLLFRRSAARQGHITDRTKTRRDLDIHVGADSLLFQVLRQHVQSKTTKAEKKSDLLFCRQDGGLYSHSRIWEVTLLLNLHLACDELTAEQRTQIFREAGGARRVPCPSRVREAFAQAQQRGWPVKMTKLLTPKVMRRTFYLLCDSAAIEDRLARLVSGHASAAMADRYRTPGAQGSQQQAVVGKLIDLAEVGRQIGHK